MDDTKKEQYTIPDVMDSTNRYIIGCDPYDRLSWFQTLIKKTGLFYKNRLKSNVVVFKWKEDDNVEYY